MEATPDDISAHPFWIGLNVAQLPHLQKAAAIVRFPAGTSLFHEGEQARYSFLIRRGQIALETGVPGKGRVTIQTVGEGDPLGFSWLFPPYEWHFNARTLEEVELMQFDAEVLRQLAQKEPEFGRELALRVGQVILERLQATRLQLMDVYGATP